MLPGMPARRSEKPTVTIVGAGNFASALSVTLHAVGYRIDEIVSRENKASLRRAAKLAREIGSSPVTINRARLRAEVVWFCVPDRDISSAAGVLAKAVNWGGKIAFHSSGALTSDELEAVRRQGAVIASVHPLMTFVRGSRPSFQSVPFAVEGDPKAVQAARAIIMNLGGQPFAIRKKRKQAYHAWGTFASPLFAALLAAAERVAGVAGISRKEARKKMLPILQQTLANYERLGAPQSFSGPIARGDAATVKKHLDVLRGIESAQQAYLALAQVALHELPVRNRRELTEVITTARKRSR